MMIMGQEFFESEIIRAYNVLGRDRGEMQNCTDIEAWFKQGMINETEKNHLNNFNRQMSKAYY